MADTFSLAHAFTEKWEGGLSHHPADPGGLTNHGISLRWVQDLVRQARQECLHQRRSCDGCSGPQAARCPSRTLDMDMDGDVDADDIRACTKKQAAALFRTHFWDKTACAALPLPLAIVLYDGAANMGAPRSVRQVQQAMNTIGEALLDHFVAVAEDGRMGPRSIDLAKALAAAGLDWLTARTSLRLRRTFYRSLAARRPDLKVFLTGWINRADALENYLARQEREN